MKTVIFAVTAEVLVIEIAENDTETIATEVIVGETEIDGNLEKLKFP